MNTNDLSNLEKSAVDFALQKNWSEALDLNSRILDLDKSNVPALLRSGFAAFQLKKLDDAHRFYKKVIALQPQNFIAIEYLEKIEVCGLSNDTSSSNPKEVDLDPNIFVELPGKTKSVSVNKLGPRNVLAKLVVGEKVILTIRKRHAEIRTMSDEYVGILPDDVGMRLTYFIEHESQYETYIHEANMNKVSVFIREKLKGKKVEKMISFPLDIPGSVARVMAQQQSEDESDLLEKTKPEAAAELPIDGADPVVETEEKETDELEDGLTSELEAQEKGEDETLLGVETEEEEEEE